MGGVTMDGSQKIGRCLLAAAIFMMSGRLLVAQVFSLDDNPSAPLTTPLPAPGATPFPPFGFGAEDPFGTVIGPPGLAPSPSLLPPAAGVWIDGTILEAGGAFPSEPELHLAPPFDAGTGLVHTYLDALSNNSIPTAPATYNLLFSVDRTSSGVAGSHSFIEAGFNQQPGDIYVTSSPFEDPDSFAGTLPVGAGFVPGPLNPPSPGANRLLFNQSEFDLTAGLPPGPGSAIPPFVLAPPIGPGTHDNVDAFELRDLDTDGDLAADVDYFFSINPDDAVNKQFASGGVPFDSAAIYIAPVAGAGGSFLYAPAAAMGLAPMPIFPLPPIFAANDIDALVVWDVGADGVTVAGVDFALFSLSPGSADLAAFGNSPADVFFTDFSGSYAVYASAADLGLLPTDNVDALEVALTGDANLDGSVDLLDLVTIAINWDTMPALDTWGMGDFDGNGVVGLSDLVLIAGQLGSFTGAGAGGQTSPAAPEPGPIAFAAFTVLAALAGRWRRRMRSVRAASMLGCFGVALAILGTSSATGRAAIVSVTSTALGGGLFQHRLNIEANDGDVLGFEILVEDPLGRINDTAAIWDTIFARRPTPPFTLNPPTDTHVLYNDADGVDLFIIDDSFTFSIATGAFAPLVVSGASRDLFQLVTVGNIALSASRLRVNVGGAGGDQNFDGTVLARLGDYNNDGVIDAADYVAFRQGLGTLYTPPDYDIWRARFGMIAGSGSGSAFEASSHSVVPEPGAAVLLALFLASCVVARSRP
jgi:hypothetical protein